PPGSALFPYTTLFRSYDAAVAAGAEPHPHATGPMELNIPAIKGIGGSLIYLVDRYRDVSIYDMDFNWIPGAPKNPLGAGLKAIEDRKSTRLNSSHVKI